MRKRGERTPFGKREQLFHIRIARIHLPEQRRIGAYDAVEPQKQPFLPRELPHIIPHALGIKAPVLDCLRDIFACDGVAFPDIRYGARNLQNTVYMPARSNAVWKTPVSKWLRMSSPMHNKCGSGCWEAGVKTDGFFPEPSSLIRPRAVAAGANHSGGLPCRLAGYVRITDLCHFDLNIQPIKQGA